MDLSAYTAIFGENLLKAYEQWRDLPSDARGDLRGRRDVDFSLTDKEIFENLPMGDLWLDSRIHEVFLYLFSCKHVELLGLYICNAFPEAFPDPKPSGVTKPKPENKFLNHKA